MNKPSRAVKALPVSWLSVYFRPNLVKIDAKNNLSNASK